MKHLAWTALLLALPVTAQPYLEAGISLHHQEWAEPEIRLSNPLGHIEAGYQLRYRVWGSQPSVFVRHQSSIPEYEDGYGLSEVGVQTRWEWR